MRKAEHIADEGARGLRVLREDRHVRAGDHGASLICGR
jgi:hypothetical protein